MLNLSKLVLQAEVIDDETIRMEFHTKSIISGRFNEILSLVGSEDEWESLITRIRRQLERTREGN